jgi:general stress protein 26
MRKELKDFILATLDANRIMAIATVRRDGAPQTTIVGFAHDGLVLYFFTDRAGQKATNIAHDDRVSVAIGQDRIADPLSIRALSLGGNALLIEDEAEVEHARKLFLRKFPEYRGARPAGPTLRRADARHARRHFRHRLFQGLRRRRTDQSDRRRSRRFHRGASPPLGRPRLIPRRVGSIPPRRILPGRREKLSARRRLSRSHRSADRRPSLP